MIMSKRAVLYARVSGDDRRTATSSIEAQLNDCRKYAAEHGYQVVAEYNEDAEKHTSGADWLPQLDKILRLSGQRVFEVLIVREVDRLARNRFKQMSVENQLERQGVKVEYARGRYEDTAEGRLLKGLMGQFAEFELEKIRQRVIDGVVRSVEKGSVATGGCPTYGYDVTTKDGRRVLVVNEFEASIVRLIYDLYGNQGYSMEEIVNYLADHKTPKPAKGGMHVARLTSARPYRWSHGTLNRILKNETYLGRWYYRKTKRVKNPETGKRQYIARPRSEWLLVNVPVIIDQALFDRVQARRKSNKILMGKNAKNFYLLSGMLTCGECGKRMTGITSHGQGTYVCNAHSAPKKHGYYCDTQRVKVEVVNNAVWGWIRSIMLSPEHLQESLDDYRRQQLAEQNPLTSMIEANEAKLTAVKGEKERLIKAYTQGVLTLDDIAAQKTALDKQAADLTQAIASFKAELGPKLLSPEDITSIQEWAKTVGEGAAVIAETDPGALQKLLRLLNVQVTLYFEDEGGRHRALKQIKITCVLGTQVMCSTPPCSVQQGEYAERMRSAADR
jgi:site-specific DNA recombinase